MAFNSTLVHTLTDTHTHPDNGTSSCVFLLTSRHYLSQYLDELVDPVPTLTLNWAWEEQQQLVIIVFRACTMKLNQLAK